MSAADVGAAEPAAPTHAPKVFSGEKRLFATYGPSTTMGYPARLRKFYRYTGKSGGACPLQISNFSVPAPNRACPAGSIAGPSKTPRQWEAIRSPRYIDTVQKLIKDNPGTPVIVLAMNCTGYAIAGDGGPAPTRILGPNDAEHIDLAKNFLPTHIHAILDDGAAMYFLSPKK